MKIGKWARVLLAAAPFLAGCGNFWQAPGGGSSSFSLSNSGNITEAQGSTGTSTITVTPGSSFTGTVTLSCAVTTALSNPVSPATCSLSSTSLTFSAATAQTSTLTATTTSTTTLGAYSIAVTGTSGSTAASTTVCAEVGSGTCSSTTSTSGNFYILNNGVGTSSIAGFSISGGKLTSISGSSYTVTGASAVAIAPSGNFLYVASQGGGITLYTISSTGALTQGVSIDSDTLAQAIQVDPSGTWLLDASALGTLRAIPITSTGLEDTSRSVQTQTLAGTPAQMAVSPNGSLVAVALGSTGFQVFSFASSSTAVLGAGSKAITPVNQSGSGSAISVAVDPQNRLLYVGEINAFPNSTTDSGALRAFTISGNTVTEFTYATPYPSGGIAPHFILPISSGAYVYVANGTGPTSAGNITGFAVTTTALTLGSTVSAGAQPLGMAEDSTDSYVFEVGSSGSPYFDAYTFDSNTAGLLDSQATSTSSATSIAIVAAPK